MIEIIQPLVGRQGDIMDLGADVLGICLGWCVAQIYRRLYCRGKYINQFTYCAQKPIDSRQTCAISTRLNGFKFCRRERNQISL